MRVSNSNDFAALLGNYKKAPAAQHFYLFHAAGIINIAMHVICIDNSCISVLIFQNSDSKPTTFDLLHAYSDYLITVTAENDEGVVQTTRTFSTLTKRMCNDFTYLFLCSGFFLYSL